MRRRRLGAHAPSMAGAARLTAAVFIGALLCGPDHAVALENTTNDDGFPMTQQVEKATFAGGCFWCMEPPFDHLPGVLATTPGYTGGTLSHPTYEQVCSGTTGHAEAVEVTYDPARIGYEQLLDVFWRNIDPTTPNRQFADVGSQYRTAIFYHTEAQRQQASASKDALASSGRFTKPIVTEIVPAGPFYPAEAYHQDYYQKNPIRYKLYRMGSGRDRSLKETWGEGHTSRPSRY